MSNKRSQRAKGRRSKEQPVRPSGKADISQTEKAAYKSKENRSSQTATVTQRSTYEAYAGIFLTIIVSLVQLNWALKSLLTIAFVIIAGDLLIHSKWTCAWRMQVRLLYCALLLVAVSLLMFPPIREQFRSEHQIPQNSSYLTFWGGESFTLAKSFPPRVLSGNPMAELKVNGDLLLKFSSKYNLVGVALHWKAGNQFIDEAGISRSKPYSIISGTIDIFIPLNSQFLTEVVQGYDQPSFAVLAIPIDATAVHFETLKQAQDAGAQIIAKAGAKDTLTAP